MRPPTFVILIACFASVALAEDFKTINGKAYKNATVSRVEPDGIVLKSKSGITKVYFAELPKDVQERFHYDSAQGAHFTADREATPAQQKAAFSEHRLGATADQFVRWYGVPQELPSLDKNFPLLQGTIHHTYAYEGPRIRSAVLIVKYWEINHQKSPKRWMELRLYGDYGWQRPTNLGCGRRAQRRWTLYCARRGKADCVSRNWNP